eukprot:scaffold107596_cov52-Prasinocladus_malaysianus.AAC.1
MKPSFDWPAMLCGIYCRSMQQRSRGSCQCPTRPPACMEPGRKPSHRLWTLAPCRRVALYTADNPSQVLPSPPPNPVPLSREMAEISCSAL